MFLKSKYIAGLLTTVTVASGFGYLPDSESGMDTWKQNLGYELNVFQPESIFDFDHKLESLKSDKEVATEAEEKGSKKVSFSQTEQTSQTNQSNVTKENRQKLPDEEMRKLKSYFKTRAVVDEDKVEGYLNIRSEASSEDGVEILGKLYPGAVAEILDEKEEWSRIESGDVTGWVKNEFLILGDDAAEVVEEDVTYKAEVQAETLNIRKGAGTNYDVTAIAEQGDKLEVVEEAEDGWIQVKLSDEENGYVSEKYVDVDYDFPTAVSTEEEQEEYDADWNVTENTEWDTVAESEASYSAAETEVQTSAGSTAQAAAEEAARQQAAEEEAARQAAAAQAASQAAAEEAARQQAAAEEAARQAAAEEAARQAAAAAEAARQQAAAEEAARQQAAAEAAQQKKYLGSFRITYYCPCTKCCGSWGNDTPGATVVGSSGQQLIAGYSVAVNPAQIPYGTKLLINGKTYIAADSGVGSNCIDIFSSSHAEALQGGMYYADVYIQ